MIMVAIMAAFASCQSNKKNAEMEMVNDSVMAIVTTPIEIEEEIFTVCFI